MSKKVKDIDIKNHTYYFSDDISIKNFDLNTIKIDEKSCKNILIYYIGYVTIKNSKYVKINSVNPLYLIFNKVDGYFEEINGSKYLTLVLTNESKETILIRSIKVNNEVNKNFHLPLNKRIEIPMKVTDIIHIFSQMNVCIKCEI